MTNKSQLKFETQLLDSKQFELISSKVITFRHAAAGCLIKRKGHEFIFKNLQTKHSLTLTLEPCEFVYSPFRWFVTGDIVQLLTGRLCFYSNNISKVFTTLQKLS